MRIPCVCEKGGFLHTRLRTRLANQLWCVVCVHNFDICVHTSHIKGKIRSSRMSLQDVWTQICTQNGIPIEVANKWLDILQANYASRSYHNWNMLEFKRITLMGVTDERQQPPNDRLTFAMFFQYFEFNVRQDCVAKNQQAFRDFFGEADIKSVGFCFALPASAVLTPQNGSFILG